MNPHLATLIASLDHINYLPDLAKGGAVEKATKEVVLEIQSLNWKLQALKDEIECRWTRQQIMRAKSAARANQD